MNPWIAMLAAALMLAAVEWAVIEVRARRARRDDRDDWAAFAESVARIETDPAYRDAIYTESLRKYKLQHPDYRQEWNA